MGVLRLEEHGGLSIFGHPFFESFDVSQNMVVFLAKALGNVPAGCHRLAVLVDKMMSFMVNMYLLVGGSLLRYT